jgi:hypothetical protein
MDLNFATDGIAQVSMIIYTSKILTDFPEPITTSCATPVADHLFTIRKESEAKFLPEAQAQAFYHTVAQLLFLCKQTRRDIQTVVSFLTTRVKCPDKDDWGKLKCVLQYLRGTHPMKLNLSADNLTCLQWWVDAPSTMTAKATPEQCCHSAKAQPSASQTNTESTPKAPPSPNLSEQTRLYPQSSIQDTLSRPKDTSSNKTFSSKTTNLLCGLKSMAPSQAPNKPNTSNADTSSFATK